MGFNGRVDSLPSYPLILSGVDVDVLKCSLVLGCVVVFCSVLLKVLIVCDFCVCVGVFV